MWPFTVEYYIKKAKKKGFTIFQIKEALKSQILWDKVLNGKSFRDSFYYVLELQLDSIEKKPKYGPSFSYKKDGLRRI